tara:strand:+ start:816 stop:1442 length:627 start_codon:yes stop_codon:yes gene_type:complete
MKKLILILIALPMIGFGQTADDYFDIAKNSSDLEVQIDNYTKSIEIDSENINNWKAYKNRALAYSSLKKYKEAISDNSKAIKLNPESKISYMQRGEAYYNLDKGNEAIADYNKAIEHYKKFYNNFPTVVEGKLKKAFLLRGDAYFILNNFEDAIADYSRSIKIDSEYFDAFFMRAAVKKELGEPFCDDYKRACDLEPRSCKIYNEKCK